jgi:hypothetical protein
MASIPEPVAPQSDEPPDAVSAAAPGYLLRALEWRTGLEYFAALRAARRTWGTAPPTMRRCRHGCTTCGNGPMDAK